MTEFVEVKTQDLSGLALDWAVAHATEAWTWAHEWYPTMTLDPTFRGVSDNAPGGYVRLVPNNPMRQESQPFNPSADWAQTGRLIEKVKIGFGPLRGGSWVAHPHRPNAPTEWLEAEQPLVAICRAIVADRLGMVLCVPMELMP
jgi:hypothetical protein